MKAILLAAGVGRRLMPYTETRPKCLVEVGGRSLLARHLDTLSAIDEIDEVHIVLGYRADQIRSAASAWQTETGSNFPISFSLNEAYTKGSIISLYTAREILVSADTISMDADVLYGPAVMRRLIDSTHTNCFLVDTEAEESGEEMMVCIRDGRAMHIARSHQASTQSGWDMTGEGVGFFRLAQADATELVTLMHELITTGQDGAEYETALDQFMKTHHCGFESIGDLPWTEIDFPEDIAYAEREVLPKLTTS